MHGRRSIRQYTDRAVEDALITAILESAVWAPSGTNLQPWHFVAVRSPENRDRLLRIMQTVGREFRPYLEARFPDHPEVRRQTLSFIETLGGAPVVILAFLQKDYPEDSRFACEQSVAAAMQNILLCAHDKGLSTCWLTAAQTARDDVETIFGQGRGSFLGMITLGYSEQTVRAPSRKDDRWELV